MTKESDNLQRKINELRERYKGFPLEPVIWERDRQKRSPYRVLIVMGLSTGVRDSVGLDVWREFLSEYPRPDVLKSRWREDEERVLRILRPLGNHAQRRKIIEAAVKFGTEIPSKASQLMQERGIGETIAEKIVGYGFGEPALPLDSHGCKFARECGLNGSSSSLRKKLKNIFAKPKWMEVHELLRLHGQSNRSTPEAVISSWDRWRALLVED